MSVHRDSNHVTSLIVDNFTDSTGGTPLYVTGTSVTSHKLVDVAIYDSSGNQLSTFGGTQYTEGDIDTTFTGTIAMAEGPSNTATPLQVDASKNLQVDLAADSVGLALETGGNLAAAVTALQIIDNIVAGSEAQVDVITMPTVTVQATDLDIRDLVVGDVVSAEPDGTALSNGQVTINTTVGGVTVLAASAGRQGAVITNQGTVACYVGTGTVTTSNGFLLNPGEGVSMPTDSEIKAITASSSTTVGFLAFA